MLAYLAMNLDCFHGKSSRIGLEVETRGFCAQFKAFDIVDLLPSVHHCMIMGKRVTFYSLRSRTIHNKALL